LALDFLLVLLSSIEQDSSVLFYLAWHDFCRRSRIQANSNKTICRLADGNGVNSLFDEPLPVLPDADDFEERLKARIKRYLVERCLYGVDIDPLAVELGRLALWVETMDRTLPFGFLDHKLKCGNSLVGCWFDRFQDYPAMAWEREGGDTNHDKFVHHFREFVAARGKKQGQIQQKGDKWTQAIKDTKNELVKPEFKALLETLDPANPRLQYPNFNLPALPEQIRAEALGIFEELHSLPVHETEERERRYKERIEQSEAINRLKFAFDTWCAVWFWSGEDIALAPTPGKFFNPPAETRAIITKLTQQYQFFHWELEFPDVFASERGGFDAIVGNPPWEIQKPNSMEFFSNIDPLYRTYGKQEALQKQLEYFKNDPQIEIDWLAYCDRLKALSNWTKNVGFPFGDPEEGESFSLSRSAKETEHLHQLWRDRRQQQLGYADTRHPFQLQGSADINTYKMFLELSLVLLRQEGRMGIIVPSGVYTDKGATTLRTEFLSNCQWQWLFGFENRDKIFDIDSRFKFCPLVIQKGGQTETIKAAFMQRSLTTWEEPERHILEYPRQRIEQFSPNSKAILEIRSERDLRVLEKMYANGILLGDDSPQGWGIKYATEFHMTADSKLFPPRPQWEAKGCQADEYGHWLKGNWQNYDDNSSISNCSQGLILSADGTQAINVDEVEDVALPFYEGRMIGQFDFSEKGWVSGKGRTAVWRDISFNEKVLEPQYLMSLKSLKYDSQKGYTNPKVAYMRISSATNERTTICAYLNIVPAGDSVFFFRSKNHSQLDCLTVVGFLGTFSFDYQARNRLGGLNMSEFLMVETTLPLRQNTATISNKIILIIGSLSIPHQSFAGDWLKLKKINPIDRNWYQLWAITPYERLRLRCILDAVIAELYGLEIEDFAWILKECDYPTAQVTDKTFSRILDPKGFWRVDKEKDPELRHTVLSPVAFHELKRLGLQNFLNLNDGEGWMLPDTLRLADYDFGHDERAKQPQPVASRLGDRFLPWQLEGTPEQSWQECERHAENLRRLLGDKSQTFNESKSKQPKDSSPQQLELDL
jgi:hypothetical protein